MLLGGFVFDFRGDGEGGPSVIQYIFLAISVLGGLGVILSGLALSRGQIDTGSRFGKRVLVIAVAFCAWAPIALVASSDTAHKDFISVILPYALYAQSILAVLIALQNGVQERLIIRTIIIVSAISCGWRLVYAVTFGGIELENARWEILSPSLPFILGSSVAAIYSKTHRRLALIGISYFLSIVFLSITRGYIISLATVLIATLVTAHGRGSQIFAPIVFGRVLLLLSALFLSLTILIFTLPSGVGERWTGRLSGERLDSGEEITLLYRLAQFKGQYDELTSSKLTLLAGKGFGAQFVFDEVLLSGLSFIGTDEVIESTNGADSTWSYPVFAHGIIMGPLFLVSFLFTVIHALRTARLSKHAGSAAFPALFSCFSLVALLGVSLTSNIFNERLGGILVGAVVAIAIRQQNRISIN